MVQLNAIVINLPQIIISLSAKRDRFLRSIQELKIYSKIADINEDVNDVCLHVSVL